MPKATKKQLLSRILLVLAIVSLMFPLTGCKKIIKVIRHKGPPAQEDEGYETEPGLTTPDAGFIGVTSAITREPNKHGSEFNDRKEIMSLTEEAGMGFIRTGFKWADVEAEKGVWNWEIQDTIVKDAEKNGVRILALVHRPPLQTWAYPAHEHLDEWLVFLDKLVDRYGDYIIDWEIWNEPNVVSGKYWPQDALPNEYAELVIESAKLIKKKQPESTVLLGGLATGKKADAFGLWEGLFSLGVLDYVDGVAFHPYEYPAHKLFSFDNKLKNLIAKYSNDKEELWITEFGRHSPYEKHFRGASYELQADINLATALAFWADGGERFFIFKLTDQTIYNPDTAEKVIEKYHSSFFGILKKDLTPKPAFSALEWLSEKLRRLKYVSHQAFNDGALIKAVDSGGKKVYFSWGETAANGLKNKGLSAQTYKEIIEISQLGDHYDEVLLWK